MDIKSLFEELISSGMSQDEAIQQLKSEIESLLQGGQIDDAMAQNLMSEIDGLGAGEEPVMEEGVEGTEEPMATEEPAMEETEQPMEEEPLPTAEEEIPMEEEIPAEEPMMAEEETQPTEAPPMDNNSEMPEDEFAIRAEELMEGGEFEDFDEAYDFAMDESSMAQEDGSMVQTMITQFLDGEIDENQVLELLRKLKAGQGGTASTTPPVNQ